MFLRAAKRVKQAVPAATFLLAGEGELMASLRALSNELGIGDRYSVSGPMRCCCRAAEHFGCVCPEFEG